jgi:hypothetical protein
MTAEVTPRAYGVSEFARAFATCRTRIFDLIANGELKAHRLGGKLVIFAEDAEDWRNSLPVREPQSAQAIRNDSRR